MTDPFVDAPGARLGVFLAAHPGAFALCAALTLWTAWRIASRHERARDRFLATGVWFCALLVLYTQLLSAIRQVHWPGLLILGGLGAALALLRGPGPEAPGAVGGSLITRLRDGSREDAWALAVLLLPLAAYAGWEGWLMLVSSETCGDNVAYHLPRLGYWLQRQSVAPFVSNDPRSGTFPPNGNILQLFPLLFLRTERLSAFAQFLAFLGTGGAIVAIARDLGASRVASVAAACCWFSVPVALGQANVSGVDVIATYFTAAAVSFAVASLRRPGASTWACLAAAALAVGTKPQVLLGVFPAASVAVGAAWRTGRRPTWPAMGLAVILVFGLALVGLVENEHLFGSPLGFRSVAWIVSAPGWRTLALNAQMMLAPLNPILTLTSPQGSVQAWSLTGALSGYGIGLLWLAACVGALAHLGWRSVRPRADRRPLEGLYAAGAGAFLLATLFLMRHQLSVLRFALPSVALLTPLIAPALDDWLPRRGWRRMAPIALLSAAVGWVLLAWANADLKGRMRPGSTVEFKPAAEMCDAPYAPLARAFEELGGDGAPRVGVVTGHYFQQRFFFGAQYRNVVVPLSYADQDPTSLDRLALDAIWLDVTFPATQLFRRPFTPPAIQPPQDWRYLSNAYTPAFIQALGEAVEYRSYEALALRLARRGSGWGVRFADAHGILFVRQRTTDEALVVMDVSAPNGTRVVDGVVYSRLGDQPVYVTGFAGRSGTLALEASFLPRGDRRGWPRRRVVVRDATTGQELGSSSPAEELVIPVKAGLNRFFLQPRPTSDGAPSDRLGRLAMGGLRLRWAP